MEIVKFLRWQWDKWETWQKIFFAAVILQIISVAVPGIVGIVIWTTGLTVTLCFMIKWFIWDVLRDNYIKYKEDRNKLFGVIKDSDN